MSRHISGDADPLAGLLGPISRGDHAALAAFYDATSSRLYGVVAAAMTDPDRAGSALARVYAQVWTDAGAYTDRVHGSVDTWLNVMACHAVIRESPERVDRLGER